MSASTINHFGPHPDDVGGMASVIRVLCEHPIGGECVVAHPTWRPGSQVANARLTAAAAGRIMRMRQDQVAHIHLSERGSFVREGALVALARRRGLTTVVTIHGASFLQFADDHARLTTSVLRRAHAVTCLDPDVAALVRRVAPGRPVELLPNPVPIDQASAGADRTDELVLFAGEIGLRKGADVMHRAWQLVALQRPRARCIMVGPVKDYVVPNIERLEVLPPVNAGQMRELLHRARVIALPSRAEGMPMILTEAMSAGRPFVSTPVGGIPELAEKGGMLVTVGDHRGMARRLVDLLADPMLAKRIGEEARHFCERTRGIEVVNGRLQTVYAAARRAAGDPCETATSCARP